MDLSELIHSWNILKNDDDNCSCWVILNQQEKTLHPITVNEIIIPFKGQATSTLMNVKNHMPDKPWRVMSDYIYFNQHTNTLIIPILTDAPYTLKLGEPICHIDLIGSVFALRNIKGDIFFL